MVTGDPGKGTKRRAQVAWLLAGGSLAAAGLALGVSRASGVVGGPWWLAPALVGLLSGAALVILVLRGGAEPAGDGHERAARRATTHLYLLCVLVCVVSAVPFAQVLSAPREVNVALSTGGTVIGACLLVVVLRSPGEALPRWWTERVRNARWYDWLLLASYVAMLLAVPFYFESLLSKLVLLLASIGVMVGFAASGLRRAGRDLD